MAIITIIMIIVNLEWNLIVQVEGILRKNVGGG